MPSGRGLFFVRSFTGIVPEACTFGKPLVSMFLGHDAAFVYDVGQGEVKNQDRGAFAMQSISPCFSSLGVPNCVGDVHVSNTFV